jgi:hypothetical protein
MALKTQFQALLKNLFDRRTAWLRSVFDTPRPGRPGRFSRKHVDQAITSIQELASKAFARDLARRRFEACTIAKKSWHVKRGKGHGVDAKRRAFKAWYDSNLGDHPCVYVFWRRNGCEYVGRSSQGAGRPTEHFVKFWFPQVTRIDVYTTTIRGLPAFECLASHHFQPRQNKFKASARKWSSKCDLCDLHRSIDAELRSIFPIRRRTA